MTLIRAIAPGEYYHVYNRAAHRLGIFRDKADYQRFLFNIIYLQSPLVFKNVSRVAGGFSEAGFPVPDETIGTILAGRSLELTAFCLMPNHFHLLLKEVKEGGIETYLQRVTEGYTKYFHKRYETSGHVFQGRYASVHVKDDQQLMHLSAYIHRNPRDLPQWKGKEDTYPWSSLQDYVGVNRWGGLLASEIIASRFYGTKNSNYADFVRTSPAKLLEEEFEK
jgi:putative transposase